MYPGPNYHDRGPFAHGPWRHSSEVENSLLKSFHIANIDDKHNNVANSMTCDLFMIPMKHHNYMHWLGSVCLHAVTITILKKLSTLQLNVYYSVYSDARTSGWWTAGVWNAVLLFNPEIKSP